ncbi:MAG: DNA topoisomerase III [Eubacteriales bacterium]|nr:DNA topoisomerase III [Eubacteriales bacterium]
MKSLVLTEKPSVAREIARVLGCASKQKNYFEGPRHVVTWALGHLVELAEPEDYDKKYSTWKLEDLPIIPKSMRLKVIRQTSHQFKAVSHLAKRNDLSDLIIATDAGREGELVARWIMELVHWQKPFRRLWISSQTDKAIKEGFASLRPGKSYDNLYHSAVCRAEADWLIGLNVTRALTCKFNAQLAAGRVQTPTLSALVKREAEIRGFKPVDYWTAEADFGLFRAQWAKGGENRFFEREKAQAICARVQGKQGKIIELKSREKAEPHPLAYDLTELQRDANKRYGFSAKQTSTVLQRLYEQHKLVTYPRTDSRYLSSDIVSTFKERMAAIAVGPYAQLARPLLSKPLQPGKRVIDDSKVTDHHAIIPTGERLYLQKLTADEARLFDLIARRFIALFCPPCIYEQIAVTALVEGEEFRARGKVVKQAGWKQVYDLRDDEDETEQRLPQLEQGQKLMVRSCSAVDRQTQPPARYTEGTLLTVMEKHNLGTPATRADIIEKLLQTETIERSGNQLVPTAKATQLLELAPEELRSPELTAKWEQELEAIARGKGDKDQFLKGIRQQARTMVDKVAGSEQVYKHHNATRSRCPECGQFLLERKGKQGVMLVCPDRACGYKFRENKQLTNRRCPQCHKKMELRQGKAGKFFQCKPCNVIEMLDGEGGKRGRKGQDGNLVKKYQKDAPLSSSLGDALKAALEDKK